ncbi:MAG: ribosome silencing factor [Bacteroidales bacterium]|nr:MAG: ribosome silencing factor [Bacteroidales bacterium]
MAVKKKKTNNSSELLSCIIDAVQDKKGKNLISLEIGSLPNAVCNHFVICNAESTTQVNAIADNIEGKVREKLNEKVYRSAGYENSIWIVLDYVDIVVHVFQTEWRSFYKLEDLWADAKVTAYGEQENIAPFKY